MDESHCNSLTESHRLNLTEPYRPLVIYYETKRSFFVDFPIAFEESPLQRCARCVYSVLIKNFLTYKSGAVKQSSNGNVDT